MDYQTYITSPAWTAFKHRYLNSSMPKNCVVCWSDGITLHHVTYVRLGSERLTDVVPVCWNCHSRLHQAAPSSASRGLHRFRDLLVTVFGLTQQQVRDRMRPWLSRPVKLSKEDRKKAARRAKVVAAMERDRRYHERMCK